jgi:two-component system, sensor histidine kinase YesM
MDKNIPILERIGDRVSSSSADPMPGGAVLPERRAGRLLSRLRLSIRDKILLALLMVVFLMSVPYVFLIVPGMAYKTQYDTIIQNITTANSINGYIKPTIDAEMWDIIAGKKPFSQGNQYSTLNDVDQRIQQMIDNTGSEKGRLKLSVIQRTLRTLRSAIDRVGIQIAQHSTFDENMVLMEQIRNVTQLIEGNVQEYALFELNRTQQQYQAMQIGLTRWAIGGLGVIVAAILFSIVAAWRITKSIYVPIKKLHDVTTTIARHDIEALVTADNADEITELGLSFNIMVGKIKELLDAKIEEHENLKKAELRALQAQINPHFLYNTLDTIIWMAEAKRMDQVVELVRVLSRFFRITLSKGKDWITVRDEIEHIESYLAIQKMRYRDILDYRIDVPDDMRDGQMLKLTLQPLVENALYHGIKNKRKGGAIIVRGRQLDGDLLQIQVEDNGIGMAQEQLAQIRALLDDEAGAAVVAESGYGINNVNQRIKLYYGQEYGLVIESEYLHGTCVSLVIPFQRVPALRPAPALGAR